jgi:hypothetical protein
VSDAPAPVGAAVRKGMPLHLKMLLAFVLGTAVGVVAQLAGGGDAAGSRR